MKAKNILLIAALAFSFMACENNTPFDAQREDDAPIILRPYNESGSGSYTYSRDSDKPLVDSVVVIPSAYTTVNWYVDGELVFTGNKINMYFPVGKYSLRIEAVTTAGKKTFRDGSLTINPIATDPYSAPDAGGRFAVPSQSLTLDGQNLSQVKDVLLCKGVKYEDPVLQTITPIAQTDNQLTIVLPEMEDGKYYLRFTDADGKQYGSDAVQLTSKSIAVSGYEQFIPTQEWTINGFNLQDVASVKVGEVVINEVEASKTAVTFTAPALELGEYTLSMTNKDGSSVLFSTSDGLVEAVKTIAQQQIITENPLWENGPVALRWDADRVKVVKDVMDDVPVGATICVYFEKLPEGDENYYEGTEYKQYYALRIITPWWGDNPEDNILPQTDMGEKESPYTFTYDEHAKALVDERGAMCLVGWGLNILKITYK